MIVLSLGKSIQHLVIATEFFFSVLDKVSQNWPFNIEYSLLDYFRKQNPKVLIVRLTLEALNMDLLTPNSAKDWS